MISKWIQALGIMLLCSPPGFGQEKPPPDDGKAEYARVEVKGRLNKSVLDNREYWFVEVKTNWGQVSWQLEVPGAELKKTAQGLKNGTVVAVSGELVAPMPIPIGGLSIFNGAWPPPLPVLHVKALRRAENK